MLEFRYPYFLILLIPCLLMIGLYFKRSPMRRHTVVIGLLRTLVFTFLVFSLATPTLLLPSGHKQVVFLIDTSRSFAEKEEEILDWIEASIREKGSGDEFAIVAFGAEAQVVQPLSEENALTLSRSYSGGEEETDLEDALLFSQSVMEHDGPGRIVLFSDGNETKGSAREAAKLLHELGIEVDVVPLEVTDKEDVAITALEVSPTLFQGEEAKITVHLESNQEKEADLRLTLNDREIIRETVHVKEGRNVYTFSHPVDETGLFVYRAEVAAAKDSYIENNSLHAVSTAEGQPKILVVEKETGQLKDILSNSGFAVETILPVELPTTLSHLLQYDSIIFNNVPATDIAESQMTLIEQAVRDFGLGFLMVGGDESFGLGGYFKTPVERLLPVEMEIKGKEQLPSLGLVIVLDRSSSMHGQKLRLAKEAAARSVELLREGDTFGFIVFDSRPTVIVETAPIDNKEKTIEKIRSVEAGGGTEIFPALQLAYEQLLDLDAQRKHIVLLTDGQSATNMDYYSLLEEGAEANITLSTVAIGQDADRRLLEQLAQDGGGRFYDVVDDTAIPAILSRETVIMTRTYIVDDPFYPVLSSNEPWGEIFRDGMPQMNAYIATTPKARAETILASHQDDPVLAKWQYGLGTTIAFTSDFSGKWSGAFPLHASWPEFVVEMVAQTLPKYQSSSLNVEMRQEGDEVVLTLTASQNEPFQLEAVVISEEGKQMDTHLSPTAPGTYELTMPKRAGLYFLNAKLTMASGDSRVQHYGFSIPYSTEFLLKGRNDDLLQDITELTEGKILENGKDVFRKLQHQPVRKTELSLWLLVCAFILLWTEIANRRLGLAPFTKLLPKGRKKKEAVIEKTQVDKLVQKRRKQKSKKEKIIKRDLKELPVQEKPQSVQKEVKKNVIHQVNREEQLQRLIEARNRRKR